MLVTLGSGESIAAGASQTWNYACSSFQKLIIRVEDADDSLDGNLTVQVGNEVIVNDIPFLGLVYLDMVKDGGNGDIVSSEVGFKVCLGSHILEPQESLYVTIRNGDTTNALTALDVSAIVDEAGAYSPVKITNYSDKVFTDTNTLQVYAWASQNLDEEGSKMTIRNQAYSSAPDILSGVSWTHALTTSTSWKRVAKMAVNQVPMNTTINYTSTLVDGVLCISGMDRTQGKNAEAQRTGRNLIRNMSPSEAKAL